MTRLGHGSCGRRAAFPWEPAHSRRASRPPSAPADRGRAASAASDGGPAGIERSRLSADPGIGFGKRLEDNLALLARAGELRERLGLPLVVGPSRKSFLGTLTGDEAADRDVASHAA